MMAGHRDRDQHLDDAARRIDAASRVLTHSLVDPEFGTPAVTEAAVGLLERALVDIEHATAVAA